MKKYFKISVTLVLTSLCLAGCQSTQKTADVESNIVVGEDGESYTFNLQSNDTAKIGLKDITITNTPSEETKQDLQQLTAEKGAADYTVLQIVYPSNSDDYYCTAQIGEDYYAIIHENGETYSMKDENGVIAASIE